jgi:PRMT5 arginine-N-methyltransferase/ribosomal protein L11 methyltransferase PrmA
VSHSLGQCIETVRAKCYSLASVHEKMLLDRARCEAYREAIMRSVRPGDVVVDLGSGTGLLSYFSVQAGAKKVYALEVSRIANLLEKVRGDNGMSDKVQVMRGHSREINLPEKCDVLVTETLSDMGFDSEDMIAYVNDVRQRMLKPSARVVPGAYDVLFMPFQSDAFGLGSFPKTLYGLDYTAVRSAQYNSGRTMLVQAVGKPMVHLSVPIRAWHLDFTKETSVPPPTTIDFEVCADGRLDGVLGWFDAQMAPGVRLANGPMDMEGHWTQVLFPVFHQPIVRRGQRIRFNVTPKIIDGGYCEWQFSAEVGHLEK